VRTAVRLRSGRRLTVIGFMCFRHRLSLLVLLSKQRAKLGKHVLYVPHIFRILNTRHKYAVYVLATIVALAHTLKFMTVQIFAEDFKLCANGLYLLVYATEPKTQERQESSERQIKRPLPKR